MEETKHVELRSEEVQEILGTPPGWLVRWGTSVVVASFTLMLLAAWVMRYPDVIGAKISISTTVPAADVVARTSGRIARLRVHDRDKVPAGALIAIIESTANHQDVLRLDTLVGRWLDPSFTAFRSLEPPRNLDLGDVQSAYSQFIQDLENFQFGKQNMSASVKSNIGSIRQQIQQLERSIEFDRKAVVRTQDELVPARDFLARQEKVYNEKLISQEAYDQARRQVVDLERQLDSYEDNVLNKQNQIIALRKSISDTSFSEEESEATAASRLRNSLNNLRSTIDQWKQTYLLTAPLAGRVSMNASYFSEHQYVKQGDQVLAIVPPKSEKLVGRMSLPVAGSGKVRPGQRVIIKLDGYPYHEFGTLQGLVINKSEVPQNDLYAIVVSLPNDLKTSYGREIPFEQVLQGQADIVTEDKGFLQRVGEQIFAGIR
jgi:multidrug resistance efflux pump